MHFFGINFFVYLWDPYFFIFFLSLSYIVSVILKIVLGEKIILAKKKEVYFEHPYFWAVLWNHPNYKLSKKSMVMNTTHLMVD